MNKTTLLAISTATNQCTVALAKGDGQVFLSPTCEPPKRHSQQILSLIDQLLLQARLSLADIDVITYYAGPGAFTGLRLGESIAQGLAFPHGTQLLALSSLEALAFSAYVSYGEGQFYVAHDARKGEAYTAQYQFVAGQMTPLAGPDLVPLGSLKEAPVTPILAIGNAWPLVGMTCDIETTLNATELLQFATWEIDHAPQYSAATDSRLLYVRNNVTG